MELAGGDMAADSADLERRWQRLVSVRDDAIRAVRHRTSQPQDAEDHVHEAMLRLARRPNLDVDSGGLRALVVRAACCLAADRSRWQRRQDRLVGRLAAGADVPSPEQRVVDRGQLAWVADAVTDLGRMERAALLHAVDGHRIDEIADLLGVGYNAVENALARARRKLRLRAAAATAMLAGLLRRILSRAETAPTAAVLPVIVAALWLPGAGGQGHAAPADQAPALAARPATSLQARSQPPPVAANSLGAGGAARHVAAPGGHSRVLPADPRATDPAPKPPLDITIEPGPEPGAPLVVVAGFPVVKEPTSNLTVGPVHGWHQVTDVGCTAGTAGCPPYRVG